MGNQIYVNDYYNQGMNYNQVNVNQNMQSNVTIKYLIYFIVYEY